MNAEDKSQNKIDIFEKLDYMISTVNKEARYRFVIDAKTI
jgi:hypothetical protein